MQTGTQTAIAKQSTQTKTASLRRTPSWPESQQRPMEGRPFSAQTTSTYIGTVRRQGLLRSGSTPSSPGPGTRQTSSTHCFPLHAVSLRCVQNAVRTHREPLSGIVNVAELTCAAVLLLGGSISIAHVVVLKFDIGSVTLTSSALNESTTLVTSIHFARARPLTLKNLVHSTLQ